MHTRHYTSLFMMTLGAIIENDTSLPNYAFQYIPGLNENLKMQVEAVFDAHIGPQVMTRAVQTKNLNDAVSTVARIKKSNTATLTPINQRNAGITNFLCRLINDPAAVSNESANSATGGSLASGIDTPEARTLRTLTEQFLGGGATGRAKPKK